MHKYKKMDEWAMNILVDPYDKSTLKVRSGKLISNYGRVYDLLDGCPCFNDNVGQYSQDEIVWQNGQKAYENWEAHRCQLTKNYHDEKKGVEYIYEQIPIVGRCLDVGGQQGRLRAFMKPGQEYIIIDPFPDPFRAVEFNIELIKAYPFIKEPVNFVCGFAEHLPFTAKSMNTVHMRSVIDHFLSPKLALIEAHRVLVEGGQLIIGLMVEGGKSGKKLFKLIAKDAVRNVLPYFGINRFVDHHIWHPTYSELIKLVEATGFTLDTTIWQQGTQDQVCYIKAIKKHFNPSNF